ncbi:hypothetical protein C7444_10397 [Sphaerotilus hippei]|uniref:Uncharacterized protein n=1 Tax=Sphaerotilus hippei TaxID=744406 RepID=A0A318H385_9BURK|nr:hypothetical protein [Sphaerotilus hippei]PXW98006.1 hypothetical protein C7444_10397 [Sphaerotilus hippei]
MGIRYLKTCAALEGQVGAEDAETLQHWLQAHARPAVNLAKCEHLHAAVLQVLLALRPRLVKPPADPWLALALQPPGR